MTNLTLEDRSERKVLSQLTSVGPDKPLGYQGFHTLLMKCGVKTDDLVNYLHDQGIKTKIFDQHECTTYLGALYAYHEPSLQKLLDENLTTLEEGNCPSNANEFVNYVAKNNVSFSSPLFDLVADAFADFKNPLRSENRK